MTNKIIDGKEWEEIDYDTWINIQTEIPLWKYWTGNYFVYYKQVKKKKVRKNNDRQK